MTDRCTGGKAGRQPRRCRDGGSAVVEFALVVPLLLIVVLAILQVGWAAYLRTTLTSVAAESARAGALSGSDLRVAQTRARRLAAESVAANIVSDIDARRQRVDGLETVEVTIKARVPMLAMLGPVEQMITAHALTEGT